MDSWDVWSKELHLDAKQISKQKKAVVSGEKPSDIDMDTQSGRFIGSHGEYYTTLTECNCVSFAMDKTPCKHMYRLAYELGIDVPPANLEYGFKKQEALALYSSIDEMTCRVFNQFCYLPIGKWIVVEGVEEIHQLISIGFVEVCEDPSIKYRLMLAPQKKPFLVELCKESVDCPKSGVKDIFLDFILAHDELLQKFSETYENFDSVLCIGVSKNLEGLINTIHNAYCKRFPNQ